MTSHWQDISTAPKDEWILAAIKDGVGGYFYESAIYDASSESGPHGAHGPYVWASARSEGMGIWARDVVTHWMPHPDAPVPA